MINYDDDDDVRTPWQHRQLCVTRVKIYASKVRTEKEFYVGQTRGVVDP